MAKHKKKHRRRRVGGLGGGKKGDLLIKVGSLAVGYLMADTINGQIAKLIPDKTTAATATTAATTTSRANIRMGVGIGLGGLLLLKKSKGTIGMAMKVSGGLLAGAGLKLALKQAGIITGYHNVPVIGRHRMAGGMHGYQSVPVIGGTPAQLSGTPGQLQGYKVGMGQYGAQGSGVISGFNKATNTGSGILNTGSGYMQ